MSGELNNTAGEVLKQVIIDAALGSDPDLSPGDNWPVYYGFEPDQPDNSITTYDTDPMVEGRDHNSGESQEHYGIQVMVRSNNVQVMTRKMAAIIKEFETNTLRRAVTVENNDYLVQAITRASGPFPMGRGESPSTRRRQTSLNVIADIRMTAAAGTGTGT